MVSDLQTIMHYLDFIPTFKLMIYGSDRNALLPLRITLKYDLRYNFNVIHGNNAFLSEP